MKKEPKAKQPKKVKEPKAKQEGAYHLYVSFNSQVFEFDTDDLFKAFREIPTPFIKSRVLVAVTNPDGKRAEKLLMGTFARNLFRNDTALRILIKRLIYK